MLECILAVEVRNKGIFFLECGDLPPLSPLLAVRQLFSLRPTQRRAMPLTSKKLRLYSPSLKGEAVVLAPTIRARISQEPRSLPTSIWNAQIPLFPWYMRADHWETSPQALVLMPRLNSCFVYALCKARVADCWSHRAPVATTALVAREKCN